ncbi:MAG: hypothetical protein QOH25_618 [Acidobacteriota bacterium]|jgi:hypothetical protein|nr:hypothetical protein [Acidobacteriota bacterium]
MFAFKLMQERSAKSRPVHENLDTTYVNLAALLRYLQQREFNGRVHVELDEYDADVFLSANEQPRVRETDHATGRTGEGEAALQRLLVRAREPGGLVSVYEGDGEETVSDEAPAAVNIAQPETDDTSASPAETDWRDLMRLSGELIATVERATLSAGADFATLFRLARLELADDYSFLDPATGRFEYSNGVAQLHAHASANAYVAGVSEALRRVVNKISTGPRAPSVRERVALELAVLARRRQSQLAKFKFTPQLNRIAGTRVL